MRISEEQYQRFQNATNKYKGLSPQMYGNKKALKYHNNKVQYNGITFDSIKEKNRYLWLKVLEEEGKISELELQKKFLLQEGFIHEGKKERPIYYITDFYYFDKKLNCYIAEDVKSEITRQDKTYRLKRKIFIHEFPWVAFREVL